MADEIFHNWATGATLYATRFQLDGNVFITDGSSDEVWGAGGNDADVYDVTMPEDGVGGHYVGDFDTSANISAGVYRVTVFLQATGVPLNSDISIVQGVMYWDGTAELNQFTLNTQIEDDVIGADGDTLESLSDQLDGLQASQSKVRTVLGPGE